MKATVIQSSTDSLEHNLNDFFEQNKGFEVISVTQVYNNNASIVTTIIYKERVDKIDNILKS